MVKTDSLGTIPCNSIPLSATAHNLAPVLRTGFTVGSGSSRESKPVALTPVFVYDSLLCGLQEGIADEPGQPDIFSVFPDPSNGNFTFQLLAPQKNAFTITIYNHLGQAIFTASEKNAGEHFTKQIDLSVFADGVYFISVETAEGRVYRKKMLKAGN